MELLLNTTQHKKRLQDIITIILAVILSVSLVFALTKTFGLYWGISNAFDGGVSAGLTQIWNHIAMLLGSKEYIILNLYNVQGDEYGFAITFITLVLIIPSFLIIKSRNRLLLLIYPIIALTPNAVWGLGLDWKGASAVAIAVMTAYYFVTPNLRMKSAIPIVISFVIAVLLMIGSSLIAGGWQDELSIDMRKPARIANEFFGEVRYGENPANKKEVALEVTMERPQQMWLRGFVGEKFTAGGWEALPNDIHYKYLMDKKALVNSGIDPVNQMNIAGDLAKSVNGEVAGIKFNKKESNDQDVKIKVKGASREYLYTPYELTNSHIEQGTNYGDSFWKAKGIFPKREYKYTIGFEKSSIWSDILGILTTEVRGSGVNAYRKHEYAINVLNYSKYLDLRDDELMLMSKILGDPGDQSKGHIDYRTAITNMSNFINEEMLYVKRQKGGINPNIAVKTGKADIRNMATLTTLMARYYGIPSRYVEGYQVRPEDAKTAKPNIPIEIKGSNFSAWTEVYVDGYGWVPLQLIDELQNDMNMADLSIGLDTLDQNGAFKPYVPPTPPENNGSNNGNDLPNLFARNQLNINTIILLIILALIFLAILLILIYIWYQRVWKRNKAFKQEDNKKATQAIYSALLTKRVPLTEESIAIGNRAAYSSHKIDDEERQFMLSRWKHRRKLIKEAKHA